MGWQDVREAQNAKQQRNADRLHAALQRSNYAVLKVSQRKSRVIKATGEGYYFGFALKSFEIASLPLGHNQAIAEANRLNSTNAELQDWEA